MGFIKTKLEFLLKLFIRLLRKILNFLIRADRKLIAGQYSEAVQNNRVVQSTKDYNMFTAGDEPYYKEQYWHWIKKYLTLGKTPINGKYLDLGCGQGRMIIPLANWCAAGNGNIIGVDFSETAILQARQYTDEANLKNVEYIQENILKFVQACEDASFDAIFFLEVAFFMKEYALVLKEAKRVLKPSGLLFASFRSQYFNALLAVKDNYLSDVSLILDERSGKLFNGDAVFTWQTSREITNLMENELQFKVLGLYGIGCCSGIGGDPHSLIVRPSSIDEDAQKILMDLEINLAESVPDVGRYILCVAQKNNK